MGQADYYIREIAQWICAKERIVMKHNRQQEMKQLFHERGHLTCKELCEYFGASIETVRRDLTELEKAGFVRRTYGGATLADGTTHPDAIPPWQLRSSMYQRQKRLIAEEAIKWIPDNATISIDSGTTSLEIAKCLGTRKNLKVITNDIRIAETVCANTDHEVCLIGGVVKKTDLITLGYLSADFLNGISHIDVAILTADGFQVFGGMADHNYSMCNIKEGYIKRAGKVIAVLDSSKFSVKAPYKVCDATAIDLVITDDGIAECDRKRFREKNLKFIAVDTRR